MDHDHTFVMLDPTTDQVLAECDGPDASGRCPMADGMLEAEPMSRFAPTATSRRGEI
jgi:hypothetical protein